MFKCEICKNTYDDKRRRECKYCSVDVCEYCIIEDYCPECEYEED